jgi:hypothetical protein
LNTGSRSVPKLSDLAEEALLSGPSGNDDEAAEGAPPAPPFLAGQPFDVPPPQVVKIADFAPEIDASLLRAERERDADEPDASKSGPLGAQPDAEDLSPEEQQDLRKLQQRDREVRAHEHAHKAVAGSEAGPIRYEYERGPDGKSYAVGGEVPINVSPIAGDPEATLRKMQRVRAAAQAPAEPSSADHQVASEASQVALRARLELANAKYQRTQDDNTHNAAPPRALRDLSA